MCVVVQYSLDSTGAQPGFFRAGKVFGNEDPPINILATTHQGKAQQRKYFGVFSPRCSEKCISDKIFNPQMNTIRGIFPLIRAIFFDFQKRACEASPSSSSAYVHTCSTYKNNKKTFVYILCSQIFQCIFLIQNDTVILIYQFRYT